MTAWNLSCPDWADRLRTGQSLIPDLPLLDLEVGDRAVAVFNKLRLADVPGTPTMADACGDWFRMIVRALFGSLDPVTRHRMIRELLLLIPKKNSKTTNGALMMLTALLLNERPHAPFIMTAPVQDVADLAFSAVHGAIELDTVLKKKLHVREHLKTIVHRETQATLEIMTFDPRVLTGQKVVGALIDELHVSAKMAKADKALRQLRGGMLPFPEAFLAFITTQSEDAPSGVFKDELTKAREIRDGKRAGAMLPVLYEFPPAMQKDPEVWRDPSNWSMVTPNLGRSIALPRLIEECQVAEDTSAGEMRAWASQHLNVEIGLALHSDRWSGADQWKKNADPTLTLDTLLQRSEVVTVGLDAGGSDDMTALYLIGREKVTGRWLGWCHCWLKESALEVRKSEAPRMRDFERDGDLTITKDLQTQFAQAAAMVARVKDAGLLPETEALGVDRARIDAFLNELKAAGIPIEWVIGIPQNWLLMGPILACDRKLAEGNFIHADQPVMDWAVSNAKVEVTKNAFYITKQASGTAKIDPVMAMLDAGTLMARNPEAANGRSFWEQAA